jgi:hypothetical protein
MLTSGYSLHLMIQFVDDDRGYLTWIARNPSGWVVNSNRNPNPSYVVLHRASCGFMSGSPTRGRRWTKDYSKTCGTQEELRHWAQRQLGCQPTMCSHCS